MNFRFLKTWALVFALAFPSVVFAQGFAGGGGLKPANNLSDVSSAQSSFNNLSLADGTPNTDLTANGPTTDTFVAAGSSTAMDLVFLSSASKWTAADADAVATSGSVPLAISLETKSADQAMKVALPGSFVRNDAWNWTPGAPLYVSETAAGISASVPTGVDGVVRRVGFAITADVLYFNPEPGYVTIDASGTIKNISGIAPASAAAFTSVTPVATTSGTTVTLATGIPSGTKLIIGSLSGVSFTAADLAVSVQIGDSGGIETASYVSKVAGTDGTSHFYTAATDGFNLVPTTRVGAAGTVSGSFILSRESSSSNTWVCSWHTQLASGGEIYYGTGIKALSAELDRLQLFGGTFDAGEASVIYAQ